MRAIESEQDTDVTRRTHLAAERTWLAWWRTGIATAATAIGVGRITPALVGGSRLLYALLGGAYGLLAAAIFLLAGRRQRSVDRALASGDYAGLSPGWVVTFSFIGSVLALATIVAIVVNT
jgi:putative membrane protein